MKYVQARILLIDDDPVLCNLLPEAFAKEAWLIQTASNGNEALKIAEEEPPDIAVCDILLPDINGMEVCKILKQKYPQTQVIFLSSIDEVTDKIVGLEIGAEDYITKPFGMRELKARLRTAVRRISRHREAQLRAKPKLALIPDHWIELGGLTFYQKSRQVWLKEKVVGLSRREFELLKILAGSPGEIFSRNDLSQKIQGKEIHERSIDAQIYRNHPGNRLSFPSPVKLRGHL